MATSKEHNRYNNLRKIKIEPVELVVLTSDDEGDVKRTGKVVHTPKHNPTHKRMPTPTRNPTPKHKHVHKGNSTPTRNPAPKVASPKMVRSPSVNNQRPLICQWRHAVTRAIQNLKAKQTMHIPAWVVDVCLKKSTSITLCSAVSLHTYECTIINPNRGPLERYIGEGWYDFLADHKPKVGDVLHFFVKSPKLMVVEVIRRPKKRSV